MSRAAPSVIRVTNEGYASNTYLYPVGRDGECIVIDPGVDTTQLATRLEAQGLAPVAVFATHGHFDHLAGAEALRQKYAATVHFHAADERVVRGSNLLMMALKLPYTMQPPASSVAIDDGLVWERDDVQVEAIHVPGHTPGSVVLRIGDVAFCGDTIYRDDVFLVRLPEQDRPGLIASIERLWTTLPPSTVMYPGHGGSADFATIQATNLPLRRLLGMDGAA